MSNRIGLWTMVATGVAAALLTACTDDDDSDRGAAPEPPDDQAAEEEDEPTEEEGVPITLTPEDGADERALDRTVHILQERVSALGLEHADVILDEETIVVEAPGVSDHDHLADLVSTTGELQFRPVLNVQPADADNAELAPSEDDDPDDDVTLADPNADPAQIYSLGPVLATGEIIESTDAALNTGQWQIELVLRSGPEGIDRFNEIADSCFATSPECPTGQLAMVFESEVQSAPLLHQPSFENDQIVISGSFDQAEADDLALILSYDALPVDLELQEVTPLEPSD